MFYYKYDELFNGSFVGFANPEKDYQRIMTWKPKEKDLDTILERAFVTPLFYCFFQVEP